MFDFYLFLFFATRYMRKLITDIQEIAKIIKNGGVVLAQVDTIFGLICISNNDSAIKKIENIKHRNRPSFGMFIRNIDIAKKFANINKIQEDCFNRIFPGYFTLILEASKKAISFIPERCLGVKVGNIERKTIGIRVPNSEFCNELLKYFDIPLIATSANISGKKTIDKFEDIEESIIDSVDAVYYDKTKSIAGISSTIIDIVDINKPIIIREGSGDVKLLDGILVF